MERLSPYVEATVVRAQSPTSVRAGDSAKVGPDGTIDGFVGGACAEASVRLYALRSLQSGDSVLLRILPSGAEPLTLAAPPAEAEAEDEDEQRAREDRRRLGRRSRSLSRRSRTER